MPQYMLLINSPPEPGEARRQAARGEEDGLSKQEFAEEGRRWAALTAELKEAGVLLDNRGLASVDTATTVRVRDGETLITDGPFMETKEMLAGFILIEVDDLDTALKYAARVPAAEYGSVEVRPVWG